MAEAANNDGCKLLTAFYKRKRTRRPNKRGKSANDNVQAQPTVNKKKKQGPILNHKKDAPPEQMMKIANPVTLQLLMLQCKR
jgi:hypothetical protein